jgi:hypothetical protein
MAGKCGQGMIKICREAAYLNNSMQPTALRAATDVGRYTAMGLKLTPITLAEANAFEEKHHRHHKPVPGAKFCIAVAKETWCEE